MLICTKCDGDSDYIFEYIYICISICTCVYMYTGGSNIDRSDKKDDDVDDMLFQGI